MKLILLLTFLFFNFVSNTQVNLQNDIQVDTHFEAETDIDSSWYQSGYFDTDLIIDFPDVQPLWNKQHKDFEKIIVNAFEIKTRGLKKALRKREVVEIVCTFRLSEKGELSEVEVVSGITPKIDTEIIRIIEKGNWTKGEHRGRSVPYRCSLTVVFQKLNN